MIELTAEVDDFHGARLLEWGLQASIARHPKKWIPGFSETRPR
jgi:hypothetical protein